MVINDEASYPASMVVASSSSHISSNGQHQPNGDKITDTPLSPTDSQVIWSWNSQVPASEDKCIHMTIDEQAAGRPGKVAVSAWDGQFTYGELEQLSTRLTTHLIELGVRTESMIPMIFEKSCWTVIAILAILKAGGAFVPLDPSQAPDRAQGLLSQLSARVLLASGRYAAAFAGPGRTVVAVGPATFQDGGAVTKPNSCNITTKPAAKEQAAYVIFTSGGTGQPKGVVVEHGALAASCAHHGHKVGFDEHTRMLQFTSYTFDVSLMEILTTLSHGGSQLLDPRQIPSLSTIILGGENATENDLKRWSHLLRVVDGYGPTECTIFCCMNSIVDHNVQGQGSRIGRAVGCRAWITVPDRLDQLAQLGDVGELLVEGPIVARGYLNDLAKTNVSFIQDPKWLLRGVPGHFPGRSGRLYRTGHLVRYQEDGSLLYLGRKDTQVKIRGQRVELAEVEHHVRACIPGARQAVTEVVIPEGQRANPTLVAFLIIDETSLDNGNGNGNGNLAVLEQRTTDRFPDVRVMKTTADMDRQLMERLPAYMIPTTFFVLENLPVNSSGKTDRHHLREMAASVVHKKLSSVLAEAAEQKGPPLSHAEQVLQEIWVLVLNLDARSIDINSSFLAIGGDSITAVQVSAAARAANLDISTADILRKKTISVLAMASMSTQQHQKQKQQQQTIITPNVHEGDLFSLSPIQQLYIHSQPDISSCFDQHFLLGLRRRISATSLEKAIELIINRHPMLRARFSCTAEGRWKQQITDRVSESFHLQTVGSLDPTKGQISQSVMDHCRQMLNVQQGPLLVAALCGAETDSHQSLFVTVHHFVIDLVSWRVLFQELDDILSHRSLPALSITSFQAWCSSQAAYVSAQLSPPTDATQVCLPLLSYWGIEPNTRELVKSAEQHVSLDRAASAAIMGSCNTAFNTRPVELLMAALLYSFHAVFDDRPLPTLFVESHGRELWDDCIDIACTIGWFTTIFPIESPALGSGLAETVRHVKDAARKLPKNGWSYFTSRFAEEDSARAHSQAFPVELMLNYAGSYQQLERDGSLLQTISLSDGRNPSCFSLIDVVARVEDGQILATIVFPSTIRHSDKMATWAARLQETLQLLASSLPQRSPGWTLADFPMAFKSYRDMATFETKVLPRLDSVVGSSDVEDIYPCGPVQEGILVAQAKDPRDYRPSIEFEIVSAEGKIPVEPLLIKSAWAAVVRRHSLLRALLVSEFPGSTRTMHVILRDPMPSISLTSHEDDAIMVVNGSLSVPSQTTRETQLMSVGYGRNSLQHHLSIHQASDKQRAMMSLEGQEMKRELANGHVLHVLGGQDPVEYDISINAADNGSNVTVRLDIKSTFMGKVQAGWVTRALGCAIRSILNNPFAPITQLDILDLVDLEHLWSLNKVNPPAVERCIHSLIEDQAALQPKMKTVSAWDGEYTYEELDRPSAQFAVRLLELGVRPGAFVPLLLDKSKLAIVAVLAVLKAGAAFVPLDPTQASDRVQGILEQLSAELLLVSSRHVATFSAPGRTILSIDPHMFDDISSTPPPFLLASSGNIDSAAYIIFTSGSSGKPKGVVVENSALATSCAHHGREAGFNNQTRMLQFTSYTFNVSIMEILTTLSHGGCICIPSEDDRSNNLEHSMRDMGVTMASLTPSISRLLDPSQIPTLQAIVLGGENVTEEDLRRWSHLHVINGYGPTECTVFCCMNTIDNRNTKGQGSCIGRAVGCVTWVTIPGQPGRLAPVGAVGELLIEGPILAQGYLKDPDRTADSFIQDPEWLLRSVPGSSVYLGRSGRLYRTGDLVRYREDGSLIYIGRKDAQVKIRGQRIELGEVEHHVKSCLPQAQQVVAEVIVPSGSENAMLAAFIVSSENYNRPTSELCVVTPSAQEGGELASRLPVYMIPTLYIQLDQLPVNQSGKTDRQRLREMGAGLTLQDIAAVRSNSGQEKRLAASDDETLLVGIWARVLNIDSASIGVDDSFLAIGGDSITAMQVSAAARAAKLEISTADILRKKTILSILATVSIPKHHHHHHHHHQSTPRGLVTPSRSDHADLFPLSPIQRLHVHSQPDATRCFDQSFLVKLNRRVSLGNLHDALGVLVSRHRMLRARFSLSSKGTWEQCIVDQVSSSFHLAACHLVSIGSGESDMARQICVARQRLDIERGPLVVALLIDEETDKGDGGDQRMLISIHHLVVDLVSWRIIFQELEDFLSKGQLPPMLPGSTTFQSWCELQTQFVTANSAVEASATVRIPLLASSYWGVDVASSQSTMGSMSQTHFVLDRAATARLLGECNTAFGTRPVELMSAALLHSFCSVFSDRPAPLAFSEGHGREPWDEGIDISRTVGWFTTIFPINEPILLGTSLIDTIRRVKEFSRSLSRNGWSYFTHKFADEANAAAHALGFPVEILFNYAGSYQQLEREDSLFTNLELPHDCEPDSFLQLRRLALFDIFAQTENGSLSVTIDYPTHALHQGKIIAWADQFRATLCEVSEILANGVLGWTRADFPAAAFGSYDELDVFQRRVLAAHSADSIEDMFCCTPTQERMLRAQRGDDRKYRVELMLQIYDPRGYETITSQLQEAWYAVAQRHSLLRTVFMLGPKGTTIHVILKNPVLGITVHVDKSAIGATSTRSRGYTKHNLQHHLSIYPLSGESVNVRIEMSHVILDGHSIQVLLRDLELAYSGSLSVDGGPSFKAFVNHVDEQSQARGDIKFWMQYLDNAVPCLVPSFHSQAHLNTSQVSVPTTDAGEMQAFCTEWEVTSAAVIQTAWAIVLHQYTGSQSPCFGSLASGRDSPVDGVADMFGPLIRPLPCRVRLDDQRTVLDTVRQVKDDFINSLTHQNISLDTIHNSLGVEESLFHTAISFQRTNDDNMQLIRLCDAIDPVEWDIYIRVVASNHSLDIVMEYWEGQSSSREMTQLAESFHAALAFILSCPMPDIQAYLG